MKWVKASERLPDKNGTYFCKVKYFNTEPGTISNVAVTFECPFWRLYEENYVIEWLDGGMDKSIEEGNKYKRGQSWVNFMGHSLRVMGTIDKWVMLRYKRSAPFLKHENEMEAFLKAIDAEPNSTSPIKAGG